jgi:hypothetical protein
MGYCEMSINNISWAENSCNLLLYSFTRLTAIVNHLSVFEFVLKGIVKKCGLFKIVHEKYKKKAHANEVAIEEFIESFENAIKINKELGALVNKAQVFVHSLVCLHIEDFIEKCNQRKNVVDNQKKNTTHENTCNNNLRKDTLNAL